MANPFTPTLSYRTFAELILDFEGPQAEAIKMTNMIYSMYQDLANTVDSVNGETGDVVLDAGDVGAMGLTGNESVAGIKTFTSSPVVPDPTIDGQASNKGYTDTGDEAVQATMDERVLDPDAGISSTQGIWVPTNFYDGVDYNPSYTRVMDLINGLTVSGGANMLAKHFTNGRMYAGQVTADRDSVATVQQVRDIRLFNQPAHTSKSADATLTPAELLTEIIVADDTVELINLTLPLAADLETALATIYGPLVNGDAIKFKVLVVNGANGGQIVTNTGWTIIGSTDIGSWFYGEFIARRTAADTFTLYRA